MKLTNFLLTAALLAELNACNASQRIQPRPSGPVIKITASRFQFAPSVITLTKGQPVTLELTSTDVTHGFMIRQLKIDTDIKPGRVTDISVTPASAGTFRAICDHYCGFGHNDMRMTIIVKATATAASPRNIATVSMAGR